jgi:Bacteriophage head to tail connecting protein
MNESKGQEILRIAQELKANRSTFEQHWQDIADVMRPQFAPIKGDHRAGNQVDGEKRTGKIIDALPPLAAEKHAAVMEAMLSPRNQTWAQLTLGEDDDLSEDMEVKRYLADVNKILFRARYRPGSNLASQLSESYLSLGLLGTQCLFVGDDVGRSIMYRSVPIGRVVIDEDNYGRVNKVIRSYQFTAEQAYQEFVGDLPMGDRRAAIARLPSAIRSAYELKSTRKFGFMHAVMPRSVVEDGRYDYKGMPFASCHIYVGDGSVIREGGYRTMPYCVSRYTKSAEELYGRGPAMIVLPDVLMLYRMAKSVIKGAERANDPPLMLTDDALEAFNLRSGAMNYGALDEKGEPLIKPFQSGAKVEIGLEMMADKKMSIREAFLLDVFQVLTQAPAMTATQVLEIAKEKAALLAPVMGRQQSELFGPMTTRELDILTQARLLPSMPDALLERGGDITIEFQSPLALAQRAESGVAIMRTLEAVLPLVQIPGGEEALRVFNISDTVRELASINNFPAKALRSKDEVDEMGKAAQEQAQTEQLLAAAPVVSQSLESMSKAQQNLAAGGAF